MYSSKFSCREFLEIYSAEEPNQSEKWALWRPFSWVGDDFVQIFMSRVLQIYSTKEPHQSQKWPIWRPFSWVGGDFVQSFMSRVSWDLKYKRPTSITEVTYLETIFMSGRCFRPSFHVESFLRSIVQKSHINHRSELSGDHFHEWAMYSSKFSCREFLEIYSAEEPHQSEKWALWRPFSWVGDDFVQIFMSRVLQIYSTKEPHQSQKWPIWRPFSWVGGDFVQSFMSRVSWDLKYKRPTSITEVTYLETIFMSGRWFRPSFHVEISWDL